MSLKHQPLSACALSSVAIPAWLCAATLSSQTVPFTALFASFSTCHLDLLRAGIIQINRAAYHGKGLCSFKTEFIEVYHISYDYQS